MEKSITANNLKFCLFISLIICLALSQVAGAQTTTKTTKDISRTTTEYFEDGKFINGTVALHGGIVRWPDGEGGWIEHPRVDYVNGTHVIYLKIDWDSYLYVKEIDRNGNIVLCRNVSKNMKDKEVPFRDNLNPTPLEIKYEPGKEYCSLYSAKDYDYFEFGEHSTTIQIITANTGNLNDGWISNALPTSNLGEQTIMYIDDGVEDIRRMYVQYNITSLPADIVVDEALVCAYALATTANSNSIYHVYAGHDMEETDVTWNNQPCGIDWDNSTNCNLTAIDTRSSIASGYGCWDFTGPVRIDYAADNPNNTYFVKFDDESPGSPDSGLFWTKEYGSTTPYLNITYSSAADETPPDLNIVAPSDMDTTTSNNYSYVNVSANENLDFCWLDWNGTNESMTVSGTLAYVNKTMLTNGNYSYSAYCNDTSDNWNQTVEYWVNVSWSGACTPNWTNTSWSAYQNTTCNASDLLVNWSYLTEFDVNECPGSTNTTYYDNHTLACNYCSYNLTNTSVTDEGNTTPSYTNGTCNSSGVLDYQMWNWTWWTWWVEFDTNKSTCCDVTSLPADCWTNVTHYDNTTYSNTTYNVNCTYTAPEENDEWDTAIIFGIESFIFMLIYISLKLNKEGLTRLLGVFLFFAALAMQHWAFSFMIDIAEDAGKTAIADSLGKMYSGYPIITYVAFLFYLFLFGMEIYEMYTGENLPVLFKSKIRRRGKSWEA